MASQPRDVQHHRSSAQCLRSWFCPRGISAALKIIEKRNTNDRNPTLRKHRRAHTQQGCQAAELAPIEAHLVPRASILGQETTTNDRQQSWSSSIFKRWKGGFYFNFYSFNYLWNWIFISLLVFYVFCSLPICPLGEVICVYLLPISFVGLIISLKF